MLKTIKIKPGGPYQNTDRPVNMALPTGIEPATFSFGN